MTRSLPNPRQAKLACAFAATIALVCGGLIVAAAVVPAPAGVLPLVAAVGIGLPVVAAWDVPVSVAVLRAVGGQRREGPRGVLDARALAELRRDLDRIPEADHPLGG